jgi:surface carbohydrate biosynthesis protein
MKRVCLIVDHPLRDLEGLVLVAAHLAVNGVEVFLVPMYQKHEVFTLRPDFVLLNYLRPAHQTFLTACLAGGIRIGVLDTEGGIRNDFDTFAQQVSGLLAGVALYCVWGAVQRDILAETAARARVRLVETGSPRYDFAAAPWRDALPDHQLRGARMVLVNTNFPVVNSRFGSSEREVEALVQVGWNEDTARRRIAQARVAMEEMIDVVRCVATRCHDAEVICRPHPFEDTTTYERAFRGLPNVRVRQEGSVFEWIAGARVMLHHNCSTAVEAFMMDVEPIVIDWLDTPLLTQQPTVDVSHRAPSCEVLIAGVVTSLNGGRLEPTAQTRAARERVTANYFHANDGRSAERVASAILESLPHLNHVQSHARYAIRVSTTGGGLGIRSHRFATLAFGNGIVRTARDLVRPSRTDRAKQFTVADVHSIIGRLARVHGPFAGLIVDHTTRRHTISALTGGGLSVRIAAA